MSDEATRRGLERAIKAHRDKIKEPPSDAQSSMEKGWLVQRTGMGTYGTDYLRRAHVALVGLGANLPQDAIYPLTKVDGEGRPLTGASRYVLHQHDSPGAHKEPNWLPAPAGDFNLIMRIYWPKESMLSGSWKIPPVQRVP